MASQAVYKDAASAVLYGSRGANGVIDIRTRMGSRGTAPTFTAGFNVGVNFPSTRDGDILDAGESLMAYFEGWRNTLIAGMVHANAASRTMYNHAGEDKLSKERARFGIVDYSKLTAAQILALRNAAGSFIVNSTGTARETRRNGNLVTAISQDTRSRRVVDGHVVGLAAYDFITWGGYNPYGTGRTSPFRVNETTGEPELTPQAAANGLQYSNDWAAAARNETQLVRNFYLNATGGTPRFRYYLSGTYFDQDGDVRKTNYKRATARVNLETDPTPYITARMLANYAYTRNSTPTQTGNLFTNPAFIHVIFPPHLAVYQRDTLGALIMKDGRRLLELGEDRKQSFNSVRSFIPLTGRNVLAEADVNETVLTGNLVSLIPSIEFRPFRGFTVTSRFGLIFGDTRREQFRTPDFGDGEASGGQLLSHQ